MKRVLFICNFKPGVGGISGQVEALQRHLVEEGFTADVYSCRGSVLKRLFMPFSLFRKVRQYDLAHIHCCSGWGFLPAVLGVGIAKLAGKRVILTYHGGGGSSFFAKHQRLVRHYLMRTDANIVLSGFLGDVFDKYRIPYSIIPNIIELDETLYRKRLTVKPDFICIRSHEEIYNIPCIFRAFKRVQEMIPNATLTLVGDGSLHDMLVSQASSMGLDNVRFTGRVPNREIYDYLDKSDILLSSPTVDNMPVSVLEAMNAGLLVISSKVGGVPYMIENGQTGLLFPSNDDSALAQCMLHALEDIPKTLRIMEAAHHEVKKYSWAHVREPLFTLYQA